MINYYSSQYLQEGLSYCKIMRLYFTNDSCKTFCKKEQDFLSFLLNSNDLNKFNIFFCEKGYR